MAVYTESPEGVLTCIQQDVSLNDLLEQSNAQKVVLEIPTSPCVKDIKLFDKVGEL